MSFVNGSLCMCVPYEPYGGQGEESLASRLTILSNLSINPRSRSYTIDTLTGINLMPQSNLLI